LALLGGCEGEEAVPLDSGAAYFPLETGLYHIYGVHEVQYSVTAEPEVTDYELKTEVVDSFPSGANAYTFVIHLSRRSGEGEPWEPSDTWSARRESGKVIVAEGNTSFVKVQLPVHTGARWNGNTFNALGADEYEYRDVGEARELGGMTFEKTMTVEQEFNEDRIVYYDTRNEIYALDAGLVYKEVVQLNYCTEDDCLGQQKIDHGTEVTMEIREYGKH